MVHYPPISLSAGDFKLSFAFIATWKAERLFLLLSYFVSCGCTCCFWPSLLHLSESEVRSCNRLFSLAAPDKNVEGDLEERSNLHSLCSAWGQLTCQSQSRRCCLPLWLKECHLFCRRGVCADKARIFVLTCLLGNMKIPLLSLKMLRIDFSCNKMFIVCQIWTEFQI